MQQNYPYPPPGGAPQYGPPPGQYGMPPGPPGGPFDPNRASSMVSGPAIGLIAVGIIGILFQLASILMNLLGAGMGVLGAAGGNNEALGSLFSGVIGLAFNALCLVLGGVVIFGATKMKSLQGYGLAMAAAVIALVPCTSPCCVLGLPIGIWALVVLLNQEVKGAFRG
jgi:hypothetical protein